MTFDYIFNIQSCFDFINNDAPMSLVYYSHFTSIIVSLILGFVIFRANNKLIAGRLLFALSLVFSLWVTIDLITWTSYNSISYMFFWSFFGILTSLIYLISIYFTHAFIYNKSLSLKKLIPLSLLFLPILLFTPTIHNLSGFSNIDCNSIESPLFTNYFHTLGIFAFISIIIIAVNGYLKTSDKSFRRQIILMTIGIQSFIVIFFTATFLDSYLVNIGVTGDYMLGNYGLFGIIIFMSFLAYLIVKFKAFDIKMLGAQALVWALVIITGAQFLFVTNLTNQILVAVTLLISGVVGLTLVRSVKKEVKRREEIHEIALKLEIANEHLKVANEGQVNLMHLMNHQVKGKFGNNRLVFDELLNNPDYSSLPDDVKKLLQQGLEDSTAGVDYVQNILKGASAQNGTLPYDMKPMDLKQLIIDIAGYEKTHAEKSELSLETHISDEDYSIIGDEIQLREAFRNLIENAIKYNSKNGSIDVSLSHTGQKILFGVKDTGIGISKDDEQRLFKSGGMGKDSVRHNVDASGFGLAFVKPVIVKHGGRVWYESNSPEKGTTFFVEMPVKQG